MLFNEVSSQAKVNAIIMQFLAFEQGYFAAITA
jgi:hypothetical protein